MTHGFKNHRGHDPRDTRQVESGPFAAFAVMHLYLLTDSDRLVNLVQWGAMLLSTIGVAWIANEIAALCGLSNEGTGNTLGGRRLKL